MKLEKLSLKHSQVFIPSLIGPFTCNLRAVKLAGTHNFPSLAAMLQQKLDSITSMDVNFSGDQSKQAEMKTFISSMRGLESFHEQNSDMLASAIQVPLKHLSVFSAHNVNQSPLSVLLDNRWTACKKRAIITTVHVQELLLDKHI